MLVDGLRLNFGRPALTAVPMLFRGANFESGDDEPPV